MTIGRKPITDKFTHLPVSRQRKWQLRQKAKKKCQWCNRPSVNGHVYCKVHKHKQSITAKVYYEKNRNECLKRIKNWKKRHPNYMKNYMKKWAKKHPGYSKKYYRKIKSK